MTPFSRAAARGRVQTQFADREPHKNYATLTVQSRAAMVPPSGSWSGPHLGVAGGLPHAVGTIQRIFRDLGLSRLRRTPKRVRTAS